jgi:hypothetical protein
MIKTVVTRGAPTVCAKRATSVATSAAIPAVLVLLPNLSAWTCCVLMARAKSAEVRDSCAVMLTKKILGQATTLTLIHPNAMKKTYCAAMDVAFRPKMGAMEQHAYRMSCVMTTISRVTSAV